MQFERVRTSPSNDHDLGGAATTGQDRPAARARSRAHRDGAGPTHPTGRAAALMVAVTVVIFLLALVAAAGSR